MKLQSHQIFFQGVNQLGVAVNFFALSPSAMTAPVAAPQVFPNRPMPPLNPAAILTAVSSSSPSGGSTGTTLLEGWVHRLPRIISIYFFIYLLLWTFVVAGALIAATGLAAHAIYPGLSVEQWGTTHSLLALVLVLTGRYALLETVMKLFIALMLLVVMICAVLVLPDAGDIMKALLIPSIPEGSTLFIFGVIGGVGGSVTLLCYGYWMAEKGWNLVSLYH